MNGDQIIFNSFFPLWLVTAVAVVLTLFFIWKEIQRKQHYLAIRIIAQLIITITLVVLIIRPSVKREKTIGAALLLTKNYNKRIADSLVEKYGMRVLRSSDADAYPKAKSITSWHSLQEDAKDIRFVVGEGVPISALEEYDLHFDYIKNKLPEGITQITPSSLKKNQLNFIRGRVNHTQASSLQLISPAGIEDSITLKNSGTTEFALRTLPKQAGRFLYKLNLTADGKILESNTLPVEVIEEQKLNILFLQQFPTFETRYLKNYLEDHGHSITLRYQVSKNIYHYEYGNRDKQLLPKLTTTVLDASDVLFITPEAINDLSQSEIQSLESAVRHGLGMILLISKPVKNIQRFLPYELTAVTTDTIALSSDQWKNKITFSAAPWRMRSSPAVSAVLEDTDHRALSGYFYQGAGVTAFQLLSETYRLMLDGKKTAYASVWSPLIEHASRKQPQPFRLRITSPFPYAPDEPVHFEVIAAADAPALYYDSIRIPLKENVTIHQLWHGTVWADQAGWHQFSAPDSSRFNFYVTDKSEWNALRVSNQVGRNRLCTAKDSGAVSNIAEYEPLSPLLFFLLFIAASGTLWLVAKL